MIKNKIAEMEIGTIIQFLLITIAVILVGFSIAKIPSLVGDNVSLINGSMKDIEEYIEKDFIDENSDIKLSSNNEKDQILKKEYKLYEDLSDYTLKISSCFYRNYDSNKLHGATDFILRLDGSNIDIGIPSLSSGVVESTGYQSSGKQGFGNYVIIKTEDGQYYRYAHFKSISVNTGDKIKLGQQIGIQGGSGKTSGSYPIHVDFSISNQGTSYKTDINNDDSTMIVFETFIKNLGIDEENIKIEGPCNSKDKTEIAQFLKKDYNIAIT